MRWPSLAEMLAFFKTRPSNLGRRLQLGFACWRLSAHRQAFEAVLDRHAYARALFDGRPAGVATLLKAYIDRRLGLAARCAAVAHDLAQASWVLGPAFREAMARQEDVTLLSPTPGLSVVLGANPNSPQEGLWALSLRDAQAGTLSQLAFGFLPGKRLVVGCVQGPRPEEAEAMAGIRSATKDLEGLPPPYFLLIVLRGIAQQAGCELMGVDLAIKARFRGSRRGAGGYHFDYAEFWRANGGELGPQGFWRLPTETVVRPQEDAPTRKRAMYRRRAQLVQAIPALLLAVLGTPQWLDTTPDEDPDEEQSEVTVVTQPRGVQPPWLDLPPEGRINPRL